MIDLRLVELGSFRKVISPRVRPAIDRGYAAFLIPTDRIELKAQSSFYRIETGDGIPPSTALR